MQGDEHVQEDHEYHMLLQEFIICTLEAFEIPGERHADSIPGRCRWWRSEHPDMTDVLHDSGATMTNSVDTTIRALDNLEILRSLSFAAFSDAAPFRHPWAETTGPPDSSALDLRQYQAAPVNRPNPRSAPPPLGPSAPVSS